MAPRFPNLLWAPPEGMGVTVATFSDGLVPGPELLEPLEGSSFVVEEIRLTGVTVDAEVRSWYSFEVVLDPIRASGDDESATTGIDLD